MNSKEKEEIEKYIDGLTPSERTDYIQYCTDEMLLILKIRQDNSEYLDKISDINLRYLEVGRLRDEYKDNERKKNN